MSRIRHRLERTLLLLWMPLVILAAPVLVAVGHLRRSQYRRRRLGARRAELRIEGRTVSLVEEEESVRLGPGEHAVLWEWSIQGGTASNHELDEQLLELRHEQGKRVYLLREARYTCADELRSWGLVVRDIQVLDSAGLLWLFVPPGLVAWLVGLGFLFRWSGW